MKYIILLTFFPLFVSAQNKFWNTSCQTARFLSPEDAGDTIESHTRPNCSGGFDVYYYYRITESAPGGTPNVLSFSTDSQSGYEVFGPFQSQDDACDSLISAKKITYSGSNAASHIVSHELSAFGLYVLKIHFESCTTSLSLNTYVGIRTYLSESWERYSCADCIPAFRPKAGVYVVSAWTKDKDAMEVDTTTTYLEPYITVSPGGSPVILRPSGDIIDGWQRIQGTVTVVGEGMNLTFGCEDGDCYFDDVRVFPNDGSMVTYVYDPTTFRLVAELDDNNYAKFYEYDEDGKLIRVKKETERGIMTIQESRENNTKR